MHNYNINQFGNPHRSDQTYRNFQAAPFTDLGGFYDANLHVLSNLIGKQVDEYWLLSDAQGQCWFSHVPVVLVIDNTQYEFTAIEQKGFSVTVNRIDLNSKHDWYALGRKIPLEWKKNYYHDVNYLLEREIKQVNILGFNFDFNAEAGEFESTAIPELAEKGYYPYGVELEVVQPVMHNASHLCIFNALGKNSLIAHQLIRPRQLARIPIAGTNL